MKKRILASTMASVMALSAGATQLMSYADVADYKGLTMTKAELKKFLEDKEIVELAENDGIDNYGSISGGNFMKAYEYAAAVANDVDLTDDDATAAYLMVKAAKAALRQYTKQELSALVEQCRPIYDSDNILNDNNDAIYKSSDWSDFLEAFEEADGYTDYDDIRITTDAYEKLDAVKNPSKMDTKTKSEINKARQNFEKALAKEFDFEPWQRGTITGSGTKYDGYEVAWGVLYQHVANAEVELRTQYDNFNKIKGLTITSNEDIVAAVKNMETATKVLNAFKSTLDSGNKSKTNKLIGTYYGQLVYDYAAADAKAIVDNFVSLVGSDSKGATYAEVKTEGKFNDFTNSTSKDNYWNTTKSGETEYKALGKSTQKGVIKTLSAEIAIRCTGETVYYKVDTTRELINGNNPIKKVNANDWFVVGGNTPEAGDGERWVTVKPNTTIKLTDVIEVNSTHVRATLQGEANKAILDAQTNAKKAVESLYNVKDGVTSGSLKDLASVCASIAASVNGITLDVDDLKTYDATDDADVKAAITAAISTIASGIEKLQSAATELTKAKAENVLALITATLVTSAITAGVHATADDVTAAVNALTSTGVSTAVDNMITAQNNYSSALQEIKDGITAYNKAVKSSTSGSVSNYSIGAASVNELTSLQAYKPGVDISNLKSKLNTITIKIEAASEDGFKPLDMNYSNWNNVWDAPKTDGAKGNDLSEDNGFLYNVEYDSTKTSGHSSPITTASLYRALTLFEGFVAYDLDHDSSTVETVDWESIIVLDNNNTVIGEDNTKSISNAAWKLLYNYTKYALEDKYKASADATYTKKDVQNLYNSSLTLADNTVETMMFNMSHMKLYNWRNAANDWLKQANSDRSAYKDNESTYDVDFGTGVNRVYLSEANSTDMYKALNDAYKQLKKEYDGFKYSYGDIKTDMVKIAKELEANKFDAATTKKLTDELEAVAAAFVKVEILQNTADNAKEFDESAVFNDDGLLNEHNRLLTSDGLDSIKVAGYDDDKFVVAKYKKDSDRNHSHYVMQTAYETLLADYKAATEAPASQVTNDVDGNGTFQLADVTALLKMFTNNQMEVAKHDINGDGKADLQDVIALLKAYTNA